MIGFYIFWYLSWWGFSFLVGLGIGVFLPWWPLQVVVLIFFCILFMVSEVAMYHFLKQAQK